MEKLMYLYLPLKTKWFSMTKAAIKIEDYREINEYWCKRLLDVKKDTNLQELIKKLTKFNCKVKFKKFNYNVMTLGYPKKDDKEKILISEHAGIEIRTGNPEWGAEPNKLYFVIKHGFIINHDKCHCFGKNKMFNLNKYDKDRNC